MRDEKSMRMICSVILWKLCDTFAFSLRLLLRKIHLPPGWRSITDIITIWRIQYLSPRERWRADAWRKEPADDMHGYLMETMRYIRILPPSFAPQNPPPSRMEVNNGQASSTVRKHVNIYHGAGCACENDYYYLQNRAICAPIISEWKNLRDYWQLSNIVINYSMYVYN